MDTEEIKPLPMPQPEPQPLADLQESYKSLQNLVFALLIICLVISGTLWIYLRRQVNTTSVDLEGLRAQTTNFIAQEVKKGPAVDDFIRKLSDFGRTHQDFAPVLARYGIKPQAATNASPTTVVPPAKTATPTKK